MTDKLINFLYIMGQFQACSDLAKPASYSKGVIYREAEGALDFWQIMLYYGRQKENEVLLELRWRCDF